MEKIDTEALRARVIAAWANHPLPDNPENIEKAKMMKRGGPLSAELAVFCLTELERYRTEPMQAVLNVAEVFAAAVSNLCEQIKTKPGTETDMDGPHTAIHLLTEHVSDVMHHLYYATHGDPEDGNNHVIADRFEVPKKEVGDA